MPYRGIDHSVEQMVRHIRSPRGALSPVVRRQAELICRLVAPKHYLSEIQAIRHWVNVHVPYAFDPVHVEWMRDPEALLDEINRPFPQLPGLPAEKQSVVRADCDEHTALTSSLWLSMGHRAELVTVSLKFRPVRGLARIAARLGLRPTQEPDVFSHVFTRCLVPRTNPPLFIVADPVAGTHEATMLSRVVAWQAIPLD